MNLFVLEQVVLFFVRDFNPRPRLQKRQQRQKILSFIRNHRNFVLRNPRRDQFRNFVRHKRVFHIARQKLIPLNLRLQSAFPMCRKFFILESIRRLVNNFVRKIQNLLRTAVIFGQSNHFRAVMLFKIHHIRRQRPLKLINRLIIIPHRHHQRFLVIRQRLNNCKLRRIGVLKLVKHNKLILFLHRRPKPRVLAQHLRRFLYHIIKIIQSLARQPLVIHFHHSRHGLQLQIRHPVL